MIRFMTAILMSLALGLASVSMAMARAEATDLMVVTLCSDDGTTTVTLDANGDPVTPSHHHCPDCLVGLTLGPLPSAPLTQRPVTRTEGLPVTVVPQSPSTIPQVPQARGPPTLI